jgi:IS5 family transposase
LERPGKPTRLMVGLSYLKHCYNLSDDQVCERWLENPYWQFFCGFDYLQHRLPIGPSSLNGCSLPPLMQHWRQVRCSPPAWSA